MSNCPMSYVAFNVLFVGCFLLYFDVVTYVETLDSLLQSTMS